MIVTVVVVLIVIMLLNVLLVVTIIMITMLMMMIISMMMMMMMMLGFNEGEQEALQKWSVFLCEPSGAYDNLIPYHFYLIAYDHVAAAMVVGSGESSSWKAVSIGKKSDKYNIQLANWWRPTHKLSQVLKSLMTFAGIEADDIDIDIDKHIKTTKSTTTDDVSNGGGVEVVVDGDSIIPKNSTSVSSTIKSIDDGSHSHSIDESSSNNVDLYRFHVSNRRPTMSYFSTASKLLNSC
jgi:hypothetical protein